MRALRNALLTTAIVAGLFVSSLHTPCRGEDATATANCAEKKCAEKTCAESTCPNDAAKSCAEDGFTRIRRRLAKTISVDFQDKPDLEALQEIADAVGVQLVIDPLIDGDGKTNPTTFRLKDCPAKVVLREFLAHLDPEVAYAIRDGFVFVSSRERLDALYDARIYRSGFLPSLTGRASANSSADDGTAATYGHLLGVIEPQSWEQNGGRGRLVYTTGYLVIWQTPHVHEQIADLFDELLRYRAEETQGALPQFSTPARAMWTLPAVPSQVAPSLK